MSALTWWYYVTVAVFQFVTSVVNQPESSSPATVTIGFAPGSRILTTSVSITVTTQSKFSFEWETESKILYSYC